MKTKDPSPETIFALNDDGDRVCLRGSVRTQKAEPVIDSSKFPERAQRSLLTLRGRTLRMLEALQASTWILLEREIAAASGDTARRLTSSCSRDELRSIHDQLLRVLDGVASSPDSDMSDPRVCAELLSGSRLLLHLGAELGRAR